MFRMYHRLAGQSILLDYGGGTEAPHKAEPSNRKEDKNVLRLLGPFGNNGLLLVGNRSQHSTDRASIMSMQR